MLTSLTTGISDYATRRAIQQLASRLSHDSKPTFAGLTIAGESLSNSLITQWSAAYSWGDHAGLYDAIGTAAAEVGAHELAYDHTLMHSPLTLGTANGLSLTGQELSLPTTATPTFASLVLTEATGNPLYAGPWTGCPDPIEAHTNIYQSIYCGNVGASVGRLRLGSNANGGFVQWNRYWDGSAQQMMDPAKSSWSLSLFGVTDNVVLQRSPAGSTTLSDVLVIRSTDRCLKNSGGGIFSGTVAAPNVLPTNTLGTESLTNPNLTSGTSWAATNDCTLANSRAEFLYSGGAESTLTQASGTLAVAGVAGRWYSFTYTTTSMLLLPALTITTSFAESAVPLPPEAGTHTVYFRAAAVPGDFVISATLTAGQRVHLDTFSLKEVAGTFEAGGSIRTNDKFNVDGSDGATQAASAGTVCDVTALAGGIATAQTQVTYATDGTYASPTSITIQNGRITAIS